jgi:hypothetical protein
LAGKAALPARVVFSNIGDMSVIENFVAKILGENTKKNLY